MQFPYHEYNALCVCELKHTVCVCVCVCHAVQAEHANAVSEASSELLEWAEKEVIRTECVQAATDSYQQAKEWREQEM